jgi:hypothetical protein
MDKPTETKALALPKITAFERRMLHLGADPATIYSPDDLETYYAIKAQEEKEREREAD